MYLQRNTCALPPHYETRYSHSTEIQSRLYVCICRSALINHSQNAYIPLVLLDRDTLKRTEFNLVKRSLCQYGMQSTAFETCLRETVEASLYVICVDSLVRSLISETLGECANDYICNRA